MDCGSLPCSSVHGILQARILEWVAISFSRGSSWPRDRTCDLTLVGQASEPYGAAWAQQKASPSAMSDSGGQSPMSENKSELTPSWYSQAAACLTSNCLDQLGQCRTRGQWGRPAKSTLDEQLATRYPRRVGLRKLLQRDGSFFATHVQENGLSTHFYCFWRTEPESPDFISKGAQGKAKESLSFSPSTPAGRGGEVLPRPWVEGPQRCLLVLGGMHPS